MGRVDRHFSVSGERWLRPVFASGLTTWLRVEESAGGRREFRRCSMAL